MRSLPVSLIDDLVDQAVGHGLLGGHEVVALARGGDLLDAPAGVVRQNGVQALFDDLQPFQVDGHVGDLALRPGGRLMDHDLRVRQREALALRAG